MEKIYFGTGCFWCSEEIFKNLRGVNSVVSGYAGGSVKNPTYDQVSTGNTGHAEVVEVLYNSSVVKLEDLLEVFFTIHDPTSLNKQGADVGTQYRSIILYTNANQKILAEKVKTEFQKCFDKPIVTEIVPLQNFYKAEEYHQNFYKNNPNYGYCQVVINPKLEKFRKKYKDLVKQSK
ncbi:peptide-methionine (S)-S-oxide reductase [candidate division WWE3 bacterium CG10_big_fil_rev_8_21_14_0_10_32_10]|uniref:Peptide methionine sulfoxide reductase MsrA n=1 Tax=candidate division WWE3 bacterium CG10_big_fil_rev_8_21_14_0_10_32_10 TaxID=1975090 RepID=A0A2H0RBL6_UNCKA|nr:MAG: peptide-methionine (S)-S-oxide reductase [candidate division WWE3 bacterium CG10_big_fil_rev_8_21_14_0_10_32_10]